MSVYRGLWGLDTRDSLNGERAPAGPKFERSGAVRHAWRDPLGWSGLDKVPTPQNLVPEIERAIAALEAEAEMLQGEIEEKRTALRASGLGALALANTANLEQQSTEQAETLAAEAACLQHLTAERAAVQEKQRVLGAYLAQVRRGDLGPPQAHLRNKAVPGTAAAADRQGDGHLGRSQRRAACVRAYLARILQAAAVGAVDGFSDPRLWHDRSGAAQATAYLLAATITLAAIGALVLLVSYWRWAIPGGLLLIFLYSLVNNLRELRARRG